MAQKIYYQDQTKQAIENFPFPLPLVHKELITAIIEIKKAAALAHIASKELSEEKGSAIAKACDELLGREPADQFPLPGVQGGAGTSIHMNVNEVIATKAEEIDPSSAPIHPNDHVNMGQSTNDVNPSALKIACLRLTTSLLGALDTLISALDKRSEEYADAVKLGRTHMQDALPTTFGEELKTYMAILQRDKKRIEEVIPYFYELNLGGTAIGNRINASVKYIQEVYKELSSITHLPLISAQNFASQTNSAADICHLSSMLNILAVDLSKMATDIRFLASGPRGGIGEISLEALQPGSSIMPGKVNPVAPESINQIAFFIHGKNLTIHEAAENSHLELAVMFPVIADSILTSLKLLISGIDMFTAKCIKTLTFNAQHAKQLLEQSTAYATLLSPHLGYDQTSALVKEALKTKKTIREVVLEKKLFSEHELNNIFSLKEQK